MGWCHPHLGRVNPALLTFLETSSQTRPELVSMVILYPAKLTTIISSKGLVTGVMKIGSDV